MCGPCGLCCNNPTADDFVIATGVTHSVKELLEIAFSHVGLDWQKHVEIDPALLRPTEEGPLSGDASKANKILGWAHTITFEQMVRMMVDSDLSLLSKPAAHGSRSFYRRRLTCQLLPPQSHDIS